MRDNVRTISPRRRVDVLGSRCVDLARCPFVASPGVRPPRFAGRGAILAALDDSIAALSRSESTTCTGWLGRVGSGRTSLLHEAARTAARHGWAAAVVGLDGTEPIEHELARGVAAAIVRLGRRHPDEPKLVELLGVARAYASANGLDLPIETPMPEISWPGNRTSDAGALFERVADGLASIGAGCFLAVDDLDRSPDGAEILAAAAQLASAGRRFLMAVTGLPGTIDVRLAEIGSVGPLSPPEVHEALAAPAAELGVTIGPDTIAAIGRRTDGHPLFVQAFARAAWNVAEDDRITPDDVAAVTMGVERELRASYFSPVLDGLTSTELRFVRAVADADQRDDFVAIARRLGDAVRFDPATSRLAPIRDALVDRRVLFTDAGGELCFALPYLERYVRTTD